MTRPADHTLRVTYRHGSSKPIYLVTVSRTCQTKAEVRQFLRGVKAARRKEQETQR